jgi:hypothetical protein
MPTRYFDYNPTYSHPGMPASTPTSFQRFVAPRPTRGINYDTQYSQMPFPLQSNRRDFYGNPARGQQPTFNRRSVFRDVSPFTMMGMTQPSTWGETGMNQPAPFPQGLNQQLISYIQNLFR